MLEKRRQVNVTVGDSRAISESTPAYQNQHQVRGSLHAGCLLGMMRRQPTSLCFRYFYIISWFFYTKFGSGLAVYKNNFSPTMENMSGRGKMMPSAPASQSQMQDDAGFSGDGDGYGEMEVCSFHFKIPKDALFSRLHVFFPFFSLCGRYFGVCARLQMDTVLHPVAFACENTG